MGYFPNGTAGMLYEEQFCNHCIHQAKGCAVWLAHLTKNYAECNNKESILHLLIPRNKDGDNLKCKMFYPKKKPKPDTLGLFNPSP